MNRPAEWYEGRPAANVRFHEDMDELTSQLSSLAEAPVVSSFDTTTASCGPLRVVVGACGAPVEIAADIAPGAGAVLTWSVLTAVREMCRRRSAVTSLFYGFSPRSRWAIEPGGAPLGAREGPENEQGTAKFQQLLAQAHNDSAKARATLRGYLDGSAALVSVVQTATDPVVVMVDSSLLVCGLRARALQGYEQRLWWLVRAAGIAHLAWERAVDSRWAADLPQLSDWLPGQPSFQELVGGETAGWHAEDPVEKTDRETFLAEAKIRTPGGQVTGYGIPTADR